MIRLAVSYALGFLLAGAVLGATITSSLSDYLEGILP